MKTWIARLLLLVGCVSSFSLASPVEAAGDLLFGGQTHAYTVLFRGNGEAIVYGKIAVPNTTSEALTDFDITLTGSQDAEDFIAYQQILPQVCATSTRSGIPCASFKDADYTSKSYSSPKDGSYYPLTMDALDGGSYRLHFSVPIEVGKTNGIVFAYRSSAYTSNWLGATHFAFTTPSTNGTIAKTSVAVSVDGDLVLKGGSASSKVTYVSDASQGFGLSDVAATTGLSESTARTIAAIGTGSVQKSASYLQAGEYLTVQGLYAESWLRAYSSNLLLLILLAGGIVGGSIYIPRWMRARREVQVSSHQTPVAPRKYFSLPEPVLGLLGAAGLVAWTVFLTTTLEELVRNWVRSDVAEIVMVILAVMIYLLIIVIPVLFAGTQRGIKSAVRVFAWEIGWLLIGLVLYTVLPGFLGLEGARRSSSYDF